MDKKVTSLKLKSNNSSLPEKKRALFDQDLWSMEDLGFKELEVARSNSRSVNFRGFTNPWLVYLFKETIWRKRVSVTPNTLSSYIATGRVLDSSLEKLFPKLRNVRQLKREHIEQLLIDLSQKSKQTQQSHISRLNEIFHCWYDWSFLRIPATDLIHRGDAPRQFLTAKPRFIEKPSQQKLRDALNPVDIPLDRAVAILLETGMRGNEVLHLKSDCLTQDSSGDWYITRHNSKINEHHTVPISHKLKHYVELQIGHIKNIEKIEKKINVSNLLFVHFWRGNFRHYTLRTFSRHLSDLSDEAKTTDSCGDKLTITSHMFRHTVGTNLINDGVPQIFVQRFLGHKSPMMTNIYAHIHDKTLREAVEKSNNKLVDINGKLYETEDVVCSISQKNIVELDAKWLKSNISAQILPNGICALPVKQSCPHANACLTCPSFRTDITFLPLLKEQLARTEAIIYEAKEKTFVRQAELNGAIQKSLTKIIEAIEHD